jgi:phospholipid/cholesterol/gamma-HCH transport system substrate-binding protein
MWAADMSKRAPSRTQLLVIAGFALSCFGILLFLWITFGGPTPFKAKSYEIKIPFDEAAQLAQQSDVRISGVDVGKVQNIERNPGKLAIATIDIDDQYAPLPKDTRALLRTKTLLAETYVELTTGNRNGPKLKDGETLPEANVAQSVQIDEIFRTFNPQTRAAFQEWMQNVAIAIQGRGMDFSNGLGELDTTFTEFDKLFQVLGTQRLAVRQLFRNGAVALNAFRGREGQLADLIQSAHEVFQTTAKRDTDIEALFRAFPTFEDQSRLTTQRLKSFATNADPLVRQLVPAAEQLSPTLIAFGKLAPEAKGFFDGFGPVIAKSTSGFPALRKLLRDDFPPFLRAADPFLRNLNPILTGLGNYRHELTAAMANVAAATQAVKTTGQHYLRTMGPLNPESLATINSRLSVNRTNAYPQPLTGKELASGLPSFDTRGCSGGAVTLSESVINEPAFNQRFKSGEEIKKATRFFEALKKYSFGEQGSSASAPAPGCTQQAPFPPIDGNGPATSYQHTFEQGE